MQVFFLLAVSAVAADVTYLATFDGTQATAWDWDETNDPVMGGKSFGTFNVDQENEKGVFNGTCALIPFLKAPGFCNAKTKLSMVRKFPDISQYLNGSFMLEIRTSTPEFQGFKFAWSANGVPQSNSYGPKGNGCFKAPFPTLNGTDWQTISLDMSSFSWDWSPFTGKCDTKDPSGTQHHCCTEQTPTYCPTAKYLSEVIDLEIWAEGFEGDFHLEVGWFGIGSNPEALKKL